MLVSIVVNVMGPVDLEGIKVVAIGSSTPATICDGVESVLSAFLDTDCSVVNGTPTSSMEGGIEVLAYPGIANCGVDIDGFVECFE